MIAARVLGWTTVALASAASAAWVAFCFVLLFGLLIGSAMVLLPMAMCASIARGRW